MKRFNLTLDEKFDCLVEILGGDERTAKDGIDLAFGLIGYSEKSASEILEYLTGHKSFNSYICECYGYDEEEIEENEDWE